MLLTSVPAASSGFPSHFWKKPKSASWPAKPHMICPPLPPQHSSTTFSLAYLSHSDFLAGPQTPQASSHIRDFHPGWSFCLSHFPWGWPDSLVTSFRSFLQMSLFQLGSPRFYLIILLIYLDIILSTEHTLYFIKPLQQLWAEETIASTLPMRKRDPELLTSVQKVT